MGRRSERAFGGFSFGIGTISEILNASGNKPEIRAQLIILLKGNASSAHSRPYNRVHNKPNKIQHKENGTKIN